MTPDRSQSPVEVSNSEEDPTAPGTSGNNQIRVKNVSEINSNEAEGVPTATNKRKLPSWMLVGFSDICKKTRSGAKEDSQIAEANESTMTSSHGANGGVDISDEAVDSGDDTHTGDKPESSHCSADASTSNGRNCNSPDDGLTSSTSKSSEPSCSTTGGPSESGTNGPSCSTAQQPLKQEPTDSDEDTIGAVGQITPTSPRDIKPAVKVEKEEATSSTTRNSCKFGIRCYRRNPMHRIEEAHPGDKDYKRPDFPAPPDGTPQCPFGDLCYRRNPTHFQSFSHPPSTDFEQNWKNYKMRLRERRKPPVNTFYDDDEDDAYFNGPFVDDDYEDEDFIPTDSDELDD